MGAKKLSKASLLALKIGLGINCPINITKRVAVKMFANNKADGLVMPRGIQI
jgi:hypothetical protein